MYLGETMLLTKVIMAFPVKEITMFKVSKDSNMIPRKTKFNLWEHTLNRYLTRIKEIYIYIIYFPYTVKDPMGGHLWDEQKLSIIVAGR